MSALVQPGAGRPQQLTTPQRTALRFMRTGALIQAANRSWYARAFPAQPVRDETVQALVARGLAAIGGYRGLYDEERRCAVATPAGEAANGGFRLAAAAPPPVSADVILREVEAALGLLDAEAGKLRAQLLQDSAAVRDARRGIAEIEARIAAAEKRLAERERARESLNARRVDLRALVAHACERLGAEIMGAGR